MSGELTKEGANERAEHPEGEAFKDWFRAMLNATASCFERDVLRDNVEHLWQAWKNRANEFDEANQWPR